MKKVNELGALGLTGEHYWLDNPSQNELNTFCEEHVDDIKLRYLSVQGSVRGVKITDFTALSHLPSLRELYIHDAITQQNFEQICTLTNLEELHIYHAGKLSTLEPLQGLSNLRGLTITTPTSWLSRLLKLPTLKPMSGMMGLEYLNLAGIVFISDGLKPLQKLTGLRDLVVIKSYWHEAEELKMHNPKLNVNNLTL